MKINELLKRHETLCLSFTAEETDEIRSRLSAEGFSLPPVLFSPILLHRDRTANSISGFAAAVLYSLPRRELSKYRPGVRKIDFCEITPSEEKSGWYDSRNRAILDLRRN